MSSKELDKLFRDKLETLKQAPSNDAWTKIQGQVAGKNKKVAWPYLKIAAAILLLIAVVSVFKFVDRKGEKQKLTAIPPSNNPLPNPVTAGKDTMKGPGEEQSSPPLIATREKATKATPSAGSEKEQSKETGGIQEAKVPQKEVALTPSQKPRQKDKTGEASPITPAVQALSPPGNNETLAKIHKDETPALNPNKTQEDLLAGEDKPTPAATGRTLVFDIEEFDMKNAVAAVDEAPEDPKKSGFKKIVDIIKSVKEGDGALAELREAKNNLLALDTKEKEYDHSK